MTDPMTEPIAVKVVVPPAERLRQLGLVPDTPRTDLRQAIADLVTDINERIAALDASAAERRRNTPADPQDRSLYYRQIMAARDTGKGSR